MVLLSQPTLTNGTPERKSMNNNDTQLLLTVIEILLCPEKYTPLLKMNSKGDTVEKQVKYLLANKHLNHKALIEGVKNDKN